MGLDNSYNLLLEEKTALSLKVTRIKSTTQTHNFRVFTLFEQNLLSFIENETSQSPLITHSKTADQMVKQFKSNHVLDCFD